MDRESEFQLSKYQRNDLFRAISASGVHVTDFELDTSVSQVPMSPARRALAVIHHPISRSHFDIDLIIDPNGGKSYGIETGVGARAVIKHHLTSTIYWQQVPSIATLWAKEIKEWLKEQEDYDKTSDLWNALYQNREFLAEQHESSFENTPFTDAEQPQVSSQIQQIKAYIEDTYELSSEQMSRVEARLDEAEQASRRMGRKDWLLLFNGAVFSLILSDLIPPQAAQHILLMALHGLGHLFGIGGPPPHLPSAG
jgi:hypothetical protein